MFSLLNLFSRQNRNINSKLSTLKITNELTLEMPAKRHFESWAQVRSAGKGFFQPWEPQWATNELSSTAFDLRIKQAKEMLDAKNGASYLLVQNESKVIGSISLFNIRRGASQSGTIGYWLSEDYNGKGYMGRSLTVLCEHGFNQLNLQRIEASCLPKNDRSINLLKQCGFKQEGLCSSYLEINGTREDHLLFARLK